jgi:hypothetical protein
MCRSALFPSIAGPYRQAAVWCRWKTWFSLWKTVKNGRLPIFYSRQEFPYKSTIFHDVGGVAHNLIHIKCVEVHSLQDRQNRWFWPCGPAIFLRMEKISL